MSVIELIGVIPAIIFPAATAIQLFHLLKTKSSDGVSALTWFAFSIGNIALFVYTEKYDQLQSIIGLLFTGLLQIFIVVLTLKYRKLNANS